MGQLTVLNQSVNTFCEISSRTIWKGIAALSFLANMENTTVKARLSGKSSGLGFQVKVLETFRVL